MSYTLEELKEAMKTVEFKPAAPPDFTKAKEAIARFEAEKQLELEQQKEAIKNVLALQERLLTQRAKEDEERLRRVQEEESQRTDWDIL